MILYWRLLKKKKMLAKSSFSKTVLLGEKRKECSLVHVAMASHLQMMQDRAKPPEWGLKPSTKKGPWLHAGKN